MTDDVRTPPPPLDLGAAERTWSEYVAAQPELGGHWIACDGAGTPRTVLRTTELRIGPIETVDDAFADDDDEGDRTRSEEFTDAHEVVFERYAVVRPTGG